MSLYENVIALINKYFYKTEEKPAKYNEWLTSEYVNGNWYICEELPTIVTPTITNGTFKILNAQLSGITIYGNNIPIDTDIIFDNSIQLYQDPTITETSISFIALGKPSSVIVKISPYFDEENNILYNEYTQTVTLTQTT